MKLCILFLLLATVILTESAHTFLGTNVGRPLLIKKSFDFDSYLFRKRIENLSYKIPKTVTNAGKTIQGILAFDLKNTGASVNVTEGGLGYTSVNLRMKSDVGRGLHYEVYIYA